MASKHECRSALLVIIEFTSCSDNHFSSDNNKFKRLTNRIAKDGKWALNNTIGRKNKIGNCYLYVTLWRELYVYRNIHTCWQRYIYVCSCVCNGEKWKQHKYPPSLGEILTYDIPITFFLMK